MYIAIIDDENEFVEIISDIIQDLLKDQNYVIHTYEEAEVFIEASKKIHYDIMLLDYNLGDSTGYSVLDILKGITANPFIILITSNEDVEVMHRAFDYHIFGYVWKSHLYGQLKNLIPRLLLEYSNRHDIIKIKANKEHFQIRLEDIYGIYSEKHYIIYQLKDKFISTRDSFRNLSPYFINKGFIQIERNTLVNLYHVTSFSHDRVRMDDDKIFHLGSKYYKNLQKTFFKTKT